MPHTHQNQSERKKKVKKNWWNTNKPYLAYIKFSNWKWRRTNEWKRHLKKKKKKKQNSCVFIFNFVFIVYFKYRWCCPFENRNSFYLYKYKRRSFQKILIYCDKRIMRKKKKQRIMEFSSWLFFYFVLLFLMAATDSVSIPLLISMHISPVDQLYI